MPESFSYALMLYGTLVSIPWLCCLAAARC